MIPKVINYCWFGGNELPESVLMCINSWKMNCPDYEIVRWDESNTNLFENDYVKEAYEVKKWAFITDYVRLKVLYEYGGIYMDTDVEVCKPLDPFLNNKAFSGFENNISIPTGIMGAEKGHPFFKQLLNYYKGKHFILQNGKCDNTTNVTNITNIAKEHGFLPNGEMQTICNMKFYPSDYFCPKDFKTGIITVTDNTVCIHHFNGSWHTEKEIQLIRIEQRFMEKYGKYGEFLFLVYKYISEPRLLLKKVKKIVKWDS
jgi:hypothetical protein